MDRRSALKLMAGLAASPAFPGLTPAVASQLVPAKSPATAWDLGINLAEVTYWTTENPFSNLAVSASRWRLQRINEPFTWDLPLPPMSQDGYPLSVPKGSFFETFLIFSPHREHLSRELVVLYDGEGRLDYFGADIVSREPGRDTIRDQRSDGAIGAQLVATNPTNPLRNLRLYPIDAAEPEGMFRPAFLDRLAPMSVVRFMDWMVTNNSKIVKWEELPTFNRLSQSEGGVALPYMIQLANTLKVTPWFNMPHLADDTCIRRFAEAVLKDLDPALPVYVEYSNEVWNGMFDQANYAREQGLRLGLSSADYEAQLRFYAQRTTEILQIWEDVFAGSKERVIGVYGSQYANDWSSETILSWGDAAQHADVLAIAPYFGGMIGTPERAGEAVTWSLDRLFDELVEEIDGQNRQMIRAQAVIAKKYGLSLVAYEGGQHLVGVYDRVNDTALEALFLSANRDPRMGALYEKHLAHWKAEGGGTFALFNSMGGYSKWGSWGLAETESDVDTAPKWLAVRKLLEG